MRLITGNMTIVIQITVSLLLYLLHRNFFSIKTQICSPNPTEPQPTQIFIHILSTKSNKILLGAPYL